MYYDGNILQYYYKNILHSNVYHISLLIYEYTIVVMYSIKVRVPYLNTHSINCTTVLDLLYIQFILLNPLKSNF